VSGRQNTVDYQADGD